MFTRTLLLAAGLGCVAAQAKCPDYSTYSEQYHAPFSGGRYNLSSQRPAPQCRTFNSTIVDQTVQKVSDEIKDPDLKRLFVNAFPNSLDTAVKWKGYASGSQDEELTFLITGGKGKAIANENDVGVSMLISSCIDINAMWLRDSANQMQSYLSLLSPSSSPNSLASLYRGVINLQARYLLTDPYCNSFQPPVESGIKPANNGAADSDVVTPPYSNQTVFECKYELDSLAAFLEVS